MTAWLDDGDVRIYVGDVRDQLAHLPDGSVDCVVTSPPYWGLRDYGTGAWDGGDPDCDHLRPPNQPDPSSTLQNAGRNTHQNHSREPWPAGACGKCGARRVDTQLGLEATPEQYVAEMVAVFREVWRVLADHGTAWINLGDSYASEAAKGGSGTPNGRNGRGENYARPGLGGLKPKDLVGIPWRVAFALQADGWYLRSDIVWSKPNPMPESVVDRPTKAHEYVFLLSKRPRYWFDAEAVRERSLTGDPRRPYTSNGAKEMDGRAEWHSGERRNGDDFSARNVRSVWQIATQPYAEAHFATFPEELVRRCLLAGCPVRVCRVCGRPSERLVETTYVPSNGGGKRGRVSDAFDRRGHHNEGVGARATRVDTTIGWSDCGDNAWRPGRVIDPFLGSGTTAKVARDHGRHCWGVELNQTYAELAARRLQQLSLLAEGLA